MHRGVGLCGAGCARPLALALVLLAGVALPARADDYVFNTDTLTFTDNGAPATSLGGTLLTAVAGSNGVASFYFGGNLDFGAGDVVTATGSRGLSIDAGNNVTIAPGATFNVSAQGSASGAGGGTGGAGGAPVAGGLGGVGGLGGAQQSPSGAVQFLTSNGFAGLFNLATTTNPVTAPVGLLNFTLRATGLYAYTGTIGVGTVAGIIAGGGTYSPSVSSPGTIPPLVGAPNSGVLVSPSVPQANLLSETQAYLQSQAAFGSGIVAPQAGDNGQTGQAGTIGSAGSAGINASGAGAAGGAGGQGGQGGAFGGGFAFAPLTSTCGFLGYGNGCGLLNGSNGQDATLTSTAGGGAPGSPGFAGGNGSQGAAGAAGATGRNIAIGSVLSGGGGGAGGGAGGGGGGGGGGSGGGAGGTGGNNDPIFGLDPGQTGGTGGFGGGGGAGTFGGAGGSGGGGGGAIAISARGILTSGGSFAADGAAGQGGQASVAANPGAAGEQGLPGGGCNSIVSIPGLGCINGSTARTGGAGAAGGTGGAGAQGGVGGQGGNGAGGTVELSGSVVNAAGSTIDAAGGVAVNGLGSLLGGGSSGDNGGRVVIASNTAAGAPTVLGVGNLQPVGPFTDTVTVSIQGGNSGFNGLTYTATGPTQAAAQAQANAIFAFLQTEFAGSTLIAQQSFSATGQGVVVDGQQKLLVGSGFSAVPSVQSFAGPQTANPFIQGGTATPIIPNLVGGAEGFGLLAGVTAADPLFAGVVADAPKGADAALFRVHIGPAGFNEDFTGYDALFFINLTNMALADPALGVVEGAPDPTFLQQLLMGGYANDRQFGGMGPVLLSALPADAIYETLIPSGSALLNFAALGLSSTDLSLADGQFVYLGSTLVNTVPEPGTAALLLAGIAGLVWIKRDRSVSGHRGRS